MAELTTTQTTQQKTRNGVTYLERKWHWETQPQLQADGRAAVFFDKSASPGREGVSITSYAAPRKNEFVAITYHDYQAHPSRHSISIERASITAEGSQRSTYTITDGPNQPPKVMLERSVNGAISTMPVSIQEAALAARMMLEEPLDQDGRARDKLRRDGFTLPAILSDALPAPMRSLQDLPPDIEVPKTPMQPRMLQGRTLP